MNLDLTDHVVVVTGGAKGIGAAIVRALVAEGARPAVIDRDPDAVAVLQRELPLAAAVVADLREPRVCQRVIDDIAQQTGRIDALVNNAGVNDGVGLEHGDPVRYRESLRTNLHHYYDLAHYALPHLKARHGSIVNIASKTAVTGQGNASGYASARTKTWRPSPGWPTAWRPTPN